MNNFGANFKAKPKAQLIIFYCIFVEEVAKNLSLSTIIVNDFKRGRKKDYVFSFSDAFKMNINNGLLLQVFHF